MELKRSNTILYCAAWAATVAFYRDQIGLPITHRNDWFVEFQLGVESFLSVADQARATINSSHGAGITLSWQVDDIAAAQRELQAAGIESSPIKPRWGAQVLYFHDPEGHRIELWARVNQ